MPGCSLLLLLFWSGCTRRPVTSDSSLGSTMLCGWQGRSEGESGLAFAAARQAGGCPRPTRHPPRPRLQPPHPRGKALGHQVGASHHETTSGHNCTSTGVSSGMARGVGWRRRRRQARSARAAGMHASARQIIQDHPNAPRATLLAAVTQGEPSKATPASAGISGSCGTARGVVVGR